MAEDIPLVLEVYLHMAPTIDIRVLKNLTLAHLSVAAGIQAVEHLALSRLPTPASLTRSRAIVAAVSVRVPRVVRLLAMAPVVRLPSDTVTALVPLQNPVLRRRCRAVATSSTWRAGTFHTDAAQLELPLIHSDVSQPLRRHHINHLHIRRTGSPLHLQADPLSAQTLLPQLATTTSPHSPPQRPRQPHRPPQEAGE